MTYDRPPILKNARGEVRTVGMELEFAGIDVAEAGNALAQALGGTVRVVDPFAVTVEGSALGDLEIALDSRYAHLDAETDDPVAAIEAKAGTLFARAARSLIPCELVTPPVPVTDIARFDDAVAALRGAGAGGAGTESLAPLALHLNPEAPGLDVEAVASVMKAFALLDPALRRRADPARLRRLLGYFGPWPDDYVRRLVDPAYAPDRDGLIDDYIDANPTRNRDLDVLPLLCVLDEARVRARLPDEKIGKRPTFHYRLPDSRVGDPDWSPARAWNGWVAVERLAANGPRRDAIGRMFVAEAGRDWALRTDELLAPA